MNLLAMLKLNSKQWQANTPQSHKFSPRPITNQEQSNLKFEEKPSETLLKIPEITEISQINQKFDKIKFNTSKESNKGIKSII